MINTTGQYQVVRAGPDTLKDLRTLHAEIYGRSALHSEAYFAEKYNTEYTGVQHTGFIAYDRHRLPIAYYGVIPCFIKYGTEIMLAAQSADTMTHPGHRYKGMFTELSSLTFALCRQEGIRLLFGFPNQDSYHGAVNKLGWKMTEALDCFNIPVNAFPLERIFSRTELLNRMYNGYKRIVLEKYTAGAKGVFNSVIADGFAGVYRNEAYLEYKGWCRGRVLMIGTVKAWINVGQGLLIGDIEGADEKTFPGFMHALKGIARKLGISTIQFHCSPGTQLHALFQKQYRATPSYPVLFQDFGSVIPPANIKFTFSDIDVF